NVSVHDHDVMFTGGVPGLTAGEVFYYLSSAAGGRALAYPDGDIGDRRGWIVPLPALVFGKVDGIEEIDPPLPADHAAAGAYRTFQPAGGVESVDFRRLLPYARGALESYRVFKRQRDDGAIDAGVRFQVGIPGAHDAIAMHFPRPSDWPILFAA